MVYCRCKFHVRGIDMEKKEKSKRLDRLYRIFFLCFALCNLVAVGINLACSIFSENLEPMRLTLACIAAVFLVVEIILFVFSMVFLARSRRLKKAEERAKEESEKDDSDEKFESK